MSKKITIPKDYATVLQEIKNRVRKAQYDALKSVNREMIALYWDIGSIIVTRQKHSTWGRSVVEHLAADLQEAFPGVSGYSASNLWRMRGFFMTYAEDETLAPMVREIGWSHNILIMEKCRDAKEREYYIRMTRQYGWTKNVLALRIQDRTYEKTLLGQNNFDQNLPETIQHQAKLAVRDEYTFDENLPIGMILCRSKKRTIVEYSLRESNKPIGVSAYRTLRPLPAELKGKLPEPKQIERLLAAVEWSNNYGNVDDKEGE